MRFLILLCSLISVVFANPNQLSSSSRDLGACENNQLILPNALHLIKKLTRGPITPFYISWSLQYSYACYTSKFIWILYEQKVDLNFKQKIFALESIERSNDNELLQTLLEHSKEWARAFEWFDRNRDLVSSPSLKSSIDTRDRKILDELLQSKIPLTLQEMNELFTFQRNKLE